MELASAIKLHQAGRARILAVATAKRIANLPDIPTLDEAGVKGFESGTWNAIAAPPKTPAAIVAKLNKAINEVLKSPEAQEHFAQDQPARRRRHARPKPRPSSGTKRTVWGDVIKEANVRRISERPDHYPLSWPKIICLALRAFPIQLSNSRQASAPVFFAGPGKAVSFSVPLKSRGDGAPSCASFSLCARVHLRTRGASRRAIAAFLYSAGPRFLAHRFTLPPALGPRPLLGGRTVRASGRP